MILEQSFKMPAPLLQFSSDLVMQFHDYIPTIIIDVYGIQVIPQKPELTSISQHTTIHAASLTPYQTGRTSINARSNSVVPVSPTVLLDQYFFKSTELSIVSFSLVCVVIEIYLCIVLNAVDWHVVTLAHYLTDLVKHWSLRERYLDTGDPENNSKIANQIALGYFWEGIIRT